MIYADQEKTAIITQHRQGKSIQELCAEYGVCKRTIYRRAKKYCNIAPKDKCTLTSKECDMLLHQVEKLKNIVAILKTVSCTVNAPLKEKLHKLELLYDQYDVHTLCEVLGVSRGTAKQDYKKFHGPEKKQNILRQQFQADRLNQIWVSDVTCFKLGELYLYTCVILDLFSRKVVAYKVSRKNSTQLITATFKIAWEERDPDAGLIFHSDRGVQYTSYRFRQLLHERSVEQSFPNSGKPYDNAVAESFFATLKKKDLYRKDYTSEAAFKRGLAFYIEFYNTQRPHRTLKNQTPCQVEELFVS